MFPQASAFPGIRRHNPGFGLRDFREFRNGFRNHFRRGHDFQGLRMAKSSSSRAGFYGNSTLPMRREKNCAFDQKFVADFL
jgi:hypothetical protein